jgi:hypothetical protein
MADLLGGTSGQILAKNSNTDMDFVWIANDQGDITGVTAGTGISITSPTGPVPTVAIDTAVTVDKTTAQTLTNKTLTSPALTTPTISTATTNGDLLYGTGSGALTRLGIGSTSQVLTVTAGVPSWATPAGGGSYTLIASGTLSGTSTSVSGISGSYKKLVAFYDNYYVSGTDTTPRIRINTITTSTYNVQRLNPTDGTIGTARTTSGFQMDEVNSGTSASNDNQVVLIIDGYASDTFHSYQMNSNPTNGNQYVYFGANTSIGAPVTSIQFQTQNGTTSWAGGTYAVYGVN